jgi:murein DD-endopeptidase MepM/ murein hydrolase activator NlpD
VTAATSRRRFLALPLLAAARAVSVSVAEAVDRPGPATARPGARVAFEPARPRGGDVVLVRVRGVPRLATVEVVVDGHPLGTFAAGDEHVALLGLDMDAPAGARPWVTTIEARGRTTRLEGRLAVAARTYRVQALTVAPGMADLDPETERRAVEETLRLRTVYRTASGERLWRGRFVRPVGGDEPGTGFGARRIINGRPRTPHSGIDFAAAVGTPIIAANHGRVALVGEFFFPGRLVVLDHGLGLHTAYFHLDTVAVTEGQLVARGDPLGTVGMTGRVTGPHLHFGAQLGPARIDPAALLGLAPGEAD